MLGPYFDHLLAWLETANARVVRSPWWFFAVFLSLYGVDGADYEDLKRLAAHPLTLLSAPPVSRSAYAQIHRAEILRGFIANPLAHLVFSLGWFWMLFVIELRRRPRIAYIAVVAVALGVASLTYDYTRVATMCALPVIVQVALGLATSPRGFPRFLRRLPFPLVFLLQFQIQDAQWIRDSRWFMISSIHARGTRGPRPGVAMLATRRSRRQDGDEDSACAVALDYRGTRWQPATQLTSGSLVSSDCAPSAMPVRARRIRRWRSISRPI
jgi:hypothetical protein